MSNSPTLWQPLAIIPLPRGVETVPDLTAYAKQLSQRDTTQIVQAFENGAYEIASTFVWRKTMSGLKKKLGSLGMDFIGEMLGRRDITAANSAQQVLTDQDALRLAEELGFFPSTQSIRLRQAMETIEHFADPPPDADTDGMSIDEARIALRTCIQTVLGHTEAGNALEFAKFRRQLETHDFKPVDAEVATLATAPYFFQRTTLRVLLALVKTAQGAQLEHALANLNAFLPAIWEHLLHPDKTSVGWCYAEVHAEGRQTAAVGVRTALLKVKGFDYVPETLRSRTFIEAAQKVLDAHNAWDNYHTEPAPVQALVSLGTTIPAPALARCFTALLAVVVGRPSGVSWDAAEIARQALKGLSQERWVYYFNECLPGDDELLGKLMNDRCVKRFVSLVEEIDLSEVLPHVTKVRVLLDAALQQKSSLVRSQATTLYNKIRATQGQS